MTKATFNYTNDKFISFEIKGHANYAEYGSDIVCSGITTATFTTIGLLKKLLNKSDYLYLEKDALIRFELINDGINIDLIKQVIQNFYEVLESIQAQYPKHLNLKIAKN